MQLAPPAGPARHRGHSGFLRLPGPPALQLLSPPGTLVPRGSTVPAAGDAAVAAEPGLRLGTQIWLAAAGFVLRAPSAVFPRSPGHLEAGRRDFTGQSCREASERGLGQEAPGLERVLGALCFLVFACATLLTSCTYT